MPEMVPSAAGPAILMNSASWKPSTPIIGTAMPSLDHLRCRTRPASVTTPSKQIASGEPASILVSSARKPVVPTGAASAVRMVPPAAL